MSILPADQGISDTQRRFLLAVMERLPRERLREVYLFAPLRQGGVETGIAVLAVADGDDPAAVALSAPGIAGDPPPGPATDVDSGIEPDIAGDLPPGPVSSADSSSGPDDGPSRFTVFTARYRLQLKGPDRGRWEVGVVEEADAPLVTVDAVVRGVHLRSGEPDEVERLIPEDLPRVLGEIPWTSAN